MGRFKSSLLNRRPFSVDTSMKSCTMHRDKVVLASTCKLAERRLFTLVRISASEIERFPAHLFTFQVLRLL